MVINYLKYSYKMKCKYHSILINPINLKAKVLVNSSLLSRNGLIICSPEKF